MIILFGTKRMRTSLGTVMLLCQRCQRPSAHAVVKLRTWFTLFFIPVIPLNSVGEHGQCTTCRARNLTDALSQPTTAQM